MAQKLEDFLAFGGYQNETFFGYFHVKNLPNSPKNGHGKSRLPYQIKHIHSGSNDRVTLVRVDILDYQNEQFYRLKTMEDFLSTHLKDPLFEPPKQKSNQSQNQSYSQEPLPINSLGIILKIDFELIEQELQQRYRKHRHH